MAESTTSMMSPPVEELLGRAGSKFSLVTLGARRARDINTYYNQLGDALGTVVPPQVTSTARKPLSIAFEEIDADKIEGVGGATGKEIPESLRPVTVVEGEFGLEEALPTGPVEAED